MHSIDMEGKLVYVNDYWLKSMGYTRKEVLGQKSELFFTGDVREKYQSVFRRLLNEGSIKDYLARLKKRNGEVIDVLLTAELTYDQRGVPTHAYTILMDISERVKAEREVVEGKYKLDSILTNAVEAIFVLQDSKVQYANPATLSILGYEEHVLREMQFQDILYQEDKKMVMENYQRRMRGEKLPERYSFRVQKNDGTVIWVEINAVFLKWNQKPAVLVFLMDITKRKNQEEKLTEQAEELRNTNEQQLEMNRKLQEKNRVLDEHQVELQEYADELKAVLEEVAVKNQRIEATNKDMKDSIEYARIIQEALLKTSYDLDGNFDHFIFYVPKDIVSGDFYFFKRFEDTYVFAVGDCTGHGVPGGFLTMLGINLLQEVIDQSNVKKPAMILEILRQKVKNVFRYSRHHDGMDIALCVYDKPQKVMHYAGANMSAILISNGEERILKPVFNPIGYYVQENPFTSEDIHVNGDEILYLYSDGFKDQFGGERGRKYQFRHFKEFLMKNHGKTMEAQKQLITDEYHNWKGTQSQLDDITVLGVKLHH